MALRRPGVGVSVGTARRCSVRARAVPLPAPPPSSTAVASIKVGVRGSKLAQLQAQQVAALLRKMKPEWGEGMFETRVIATAGDTHAEPQLRALGQGAFTEAIDAAVAEGVVDIGVHSLKDSPVWLPEGVQLAATLPRDDPRDALISLTAHTLADLPNGARVGTSSLRRKAQLLHAHPHLKVVPVRGNIQGRLELLHKGELDAIVLAAAGLSRLGQQHLITRVLDFAEMLPAACQGAVGVTCGARDQLLRFELGLICHEPTKLEVAAERACLAELLAPASEDEGSGSSSDRSGSGVTSPGASPPPIRGVSSVTGLPLLPSFAIACHAGFDPHSGELKVEGLVASEDGRMLQREAAAGGAGSPEEAEEIGRQVGAQLRAFADQHGWLDL